MVPSVLLCLKPDLHQSKERALLHQLISTITAKLQTAKMHLVSLSWATADKLISNYIYNRLHYLFHLQIHLLKYWWVRLIQNSDVFQIEWIPGAKKLTWWQSYWVALWCYSTKLSIKILEYIMKKVLLVSYLKGGKKESMLFTLLRSISAFQSHTRDLMDTKSGYFQ